jgi:hypothetical protein
LWISKKELERLKQLEQSFFKCCMRRNSDEDCRYKEMQKNLASFSTHYAERLEWWKGQFDKETKPHIARFVLKNQIREIKFKSDAEFEDNKHIYAVALGPGNGTTFWIDGLLVPRESIISIDFIQGHPEPYTNEEITAWAKEQLEKEMKEWKVVKEERHCLTAQEVRITEENERKQREYYRQMQSALRPANEPFVSGLTFGVFNQFGPKLW